MFYKHCFAQICWAINFFSMTKDQLIRQFRQSHEELINFVGALSDDQFLQSRDGKWTPGQQLAHILLCLTPISQALSSADFIREKFGVLTRPGMNYDEVIARYKEGLENGGKAPERFVPQLVTLDSRQQINQDLDVLLSTIEVRLSVYTDVDLDTLVLPHPFLEALSIKELFYLMSYHATHHLNQIKVNLHVV